MTKQPSAVDLTQYRDTQTTFSLAVNLNFKLPLTLGLCCVKEILIELPTSAIPGWAWGLSSERWVIMGRKDV